MFDNLLGLELPLAARFFIAFVVVLALIAGTFWLIRRFGANRVGGNQARGRQPRRPQRPPPDLPPVEVRQSPPTADVNLADMAQRLEAALRRPGGDLRVEARPEPRPAPPPRPAPRNFPPVEAAPAARPAPRPA